MRVFPPATAAYFARRAAMQAAALVWFSARDRATGSTETIGFWTGADHQTFSIEGQARTYFGAGAMLALDPIKTGTGVQVRSYKLTFSQVSTEVQQAIRGYDPRHSPVEIHRALFDPETGALIDEPHILLRGSVDKITLPTPKKGESGSVTIEVASLARALTKGLSRYRSHATLAERSAADTFRKWTTRSNTIKVPWGSS